MGFEPVLAGSIDWFIADGVNDMLVLAGYVDRCERWLFAGHRCLSAIDPQLNRMSRVLVDGNEKRMSIAFKSTRNCGLYSRNNLLGLLSSFYRALALCAFWATARLSCTDAHFPISPNY